jgi:hypothetical protein
VRFRAPLRQQVLDHVNVARDSPPAARQPVSPPVHIALIRCGFPSIPALLSPKSPTCAHCVGPPDVINRSRALQLVTLGLAFGSCRGQLLPAFVRTLGSVLSLMLRCDLRAGCDAAASADAVRLGLDVGTGVYVLVAEGLQCNRRQLLLSCQS